VTNERVEESLRRADAAADDLGTTRLVARNLADEVRRLRALLGEAATDLADRGAYAGEYFIEKHDLAGDVERYKSAAEGRS
jgi:hypothetical protein